MDQDRRLLRERRNDFFAVTVRYLPPRMRPGWSLRFDYQPPRACCSQKPVPFSAGARDGEYTAAQFHGE